MKYNDFRETLKNVPVFHSRMLTHITDDVPTLRRQISEWIGKGYVLTLKRGLYTLRDDDRQAKFSRYYLANQIYSPSYISLETALSFYNLIPEGVYAVTSVTTKKTQTFTNHFGQFIYHHIQPHCFNGFELIHDEFKNPVYMASKERAILDFLYLKCISSSHMDKNVFAESYRFQHYDSLDREKLLLLSNAFPQKWMQRLIYLFLEFLEDDHA